MPYVIITGDVVFGALTQAAMGNASAAEVVPANAHRECLILCNSSDTTGYFRFSSGALNSGNYAWRLLAGQTITFDPPTSKQAIYAICYAASKNISYQEAP